MTKTLTLKIPDDLDARLTGVARRRRVSRSELVRESIARYLEARGRPSRGSVLDLVEDLVGSLEGPPDLSTNRDHLRGYGR